MRTSASTTVFTTTTGDTAESIAATVAADIRADQRANSRERGIRKPRVTRRPWAVTGEPFDPTRVSKTLSPSHTG